MEREVRKDWQPWVKQHAATPTGIVIETRAQFEFTAAPGSTDDGRVRRITQHLPHVYASRPFDAQAAGATEQHLQVIAEGLQEIYFSLALSVILLFPGVSA
jgi:hypothetical protein